MSCFGSFDFVNEALNGWVKSFKLIFHKKTKMKRTASTTATTTTTTAAATTALK